MKVAIAFDHRGTKLRERVLADLAALGHEAVDLGTDQPEPRIDYPDKARELGEAIRAGEAERGILVCGSGVGASAPGQVVLEKFGFTPDNVADRARSLLGRLDSGSGKD